MFADYYKAHKAELPITIWRDAPVQHFDTRSGDYVWPVPSDICKAVPQIELLQDNSLKALHPSAQVNCSARPFGAASQAVRQNMVLPLLSEDFKRPQHAMFYSNASICTVSCYLNSFLVQNKAETAKEKSPQGDVYARHVAELIAWQSLGLFCTRRSWQKEVGGIKLRCLSCKAWAFPSSIPGIKACPCGSTTPTSVRRTGIAPTCATPLSISTGSLSCTRL